MAPLSIWTKDVWGIGASQSSSRNSHLLWDNYMVPIEELEDRSIAPATILKIISRHDN